MTITTTEVIVLVVLLLTWRLLGPIIELYGAWKDKREKEEEDRQWRLLCYKAQKLREQDEWEAENFHYDRGDV